MYSCESSTCPLFICVCCCLRLFSSRSFHNLGMLLLSYISCMLQMYHFFLRLFFQFVSLIPVLLCNCLLMYVCLLFFFCLIFNFFSLLFFCFVTHVCKSPNHGGNKDIYILTTSKVNPLYVHCSPIFNLPLLNTMIVSPTTGMYCNNHEVNLDCYVNLPDCSQILPCRLQTKE